MRKILRLKSLSLLTAFIIGVALIGTAAAHHGWSHYDESKVLNLTGVIRESGYTHPHGFARLQVNGGKGKVWYVVLAPPTRMQGRGLTREMLKEGTTATVVGYPHRQKAGEMRAERITINGQTTELR
jgi:Family of unknown function (DUF6152)